MLGGALGVGARFGLRNVAGRVGEFFPMGTLVVERYGPFLSVLRRLDSGEGPFFVRSGFDILYDRVCGGYTFTIFIVKSTDTDLIRDGRMAQGLFEYGWSRSSAARGRWLGRVLALAILPNR